MIYYLVLFIGFFLVAFIIRIYRSVFFTVAQDSVALVDKLLSNAEDEIKIKLIQKNTNKLVLSLFKLLLVIFSAFATGSIPVIIFCVTTQTSYNSLDFSSLYSIIAISLGATIPFIIPLRNNKKSDYSELSKLLHRLALDNYNIANNLFNYEKKKTKRKTFERRDDFVIISGLARAGTTSLMNDLSKIDGFVSLSYANMPFLMSPNVWRRIYNPKVKELKERSHKDGIMIGLDSNEALEEFFFKVKANDDYIHDLYLSEYILSEGDYNDYLVYQSNIKCDNDKIYLAKNNNFLLRYQSLRKLNDKFVMVILYRDPLTHAASLLEKHLDYITLQKEDPFVLEYMNWLGHHEFGLNQKQFLFDNSKVLTDDKNTLDYWLNTWINYYSYAVKISHPKTILINYNTYCNNPRQIIEKIMDNIEMKGDIPAFEAFNNRRKVETKASNEVLKTAYLLYNKLNNQSYIHYNS